MRVLFWTPVFWPKIGGVEVRKVQVLRPAGRFGRCAPRADADRCDERQRGEDAIHAGLKSYSDRVQPPSGFGRQRLLCMSTMISQGFPGR